MPYGVYALVYRHELGEAGEYVCGARAGNTISITFPIGEGAVQACFCERKREGKGMFLGMVRCDYSLLWLLYPCCAA